MKKLIMAIAVVGMVSATSCKKAEEKPVETTVTETIQKAADQGNQVLEEVKEVAANIAEIPAFKNEKLAEAAKEYSNYARDIIQAQKEGANDKLAELQKKGAEWNAKMAELTQGMTEEDNKLWQEWTQKVNELINAN